MSDLARNLAAWDGLPDSAAVTVNLGVLRAAVGSGWQPIETAPRNSTRVLIITPEDFVLTARWYTYNGLATWRDEEQDIYPTATHWQPLPLPPLTA